ncbi:hypothetical protein Val02_66510 [Virgisporangium aliadipatigenens]|uniref:Uncharacterized protein n=1 Tax=Virgisporangium aliadipatigenens TaxID=741659 RepID=A0A8J4DSZ6_9ACTN|nr:hypothetical protein [Virgisporangium aliadipatigenens]GIJ49765.1 hypothetical protein Val02_66510 [Virgisporangium aliadipatigenens]
MSPEELFDIALAYAAARARAAQLRARAALSRDRDTTTTYRSKAKTATRRADLFREKLRHGLHQAGGSTTTTDAVSLPLNVAEFLRYCLHNAAERWRAAIAHAAAGTVQPPQSSPAEPEHPTAEPRPAGYRGARRLLTGDLERVEHLSRLLDQHLDHVRAGDETEEQP